MIKLISITQIQIHYLSDLNRRFKIFLEFYGFTEFLLVFVDLNRYLIELVLKILNKFIFIYIFINKIFIYCVWDCYNNRWLTSIYYNINNYTINKTPRTGYTWWLLFFIKISYFIYYWGFKSPSWLGIIISLSNFIIYKKIPLMSSKKFN